MLPIFILGVSSEILLRKIPNDYVLKRKFLDNYSDSIKVLFLGSSHAFYGVNPAYFSSKSFNASYPSQTLNYDFEILKKYRNNWKDLECIAIPISYFSLFVSFDTGIESWRVKNYNIYYGMNMSNKFVDNTEALSNKLSVNLDRLYSYYVCGNSNISCSSLGWGIDFNSKNKKDLNKTGKQAAKRHSTKDNRYLTANINTLKAIIEFAKNRGVRVLLYTPPAYHTYSENLNSTQLSQTISTVKNIGREYNNVVYVNFLTDPSFLAADFFDADHMDEVGAKKLTHKIDVLINQNKKNTWR